MRMVPAPGRKNPRAGPSRARSARARLAEQAGILPAYVGHAGERRTSEQTRIALLEAMGLPAASESEARDSLARLAAEARGRLLPATVVVRLDGEPRRQRVTLPRELRAAGSWTLELRDETGATRAITGRRRSGEDAIEVPLAGLAPGYHRLALTIEAPRRSVTAEQLLVAAPATAFSPEEQRVAGGFGLTANLYSVRGRRSWGIGDLSDLASLVRWAGELGAAFVGLNPLHALRIEAGGISPYSPDSRLHSSPIYLDVAAVPELGSAPAIRRTLESHRLRERLARLRAGARVDYAAVWAVKHPILRRLHRVFARQVRESDTGRGRAYRAFVESRGRALEDHATFRALALQLGGDWRRWPRGFATPRSATVARYRAENAEEVDFHRFLQFELDRQLAGASRAAALPTGLYQDLAIGSSPAGSDAWAFPGTFLRDVHLGAPPDPFQAEGQDWSLPPLDPLALARDGYRYWILLLRAAFRHAGALRIDHILGLARQFWVPAGRSPTEGAYVRFPFDDLAGILALESRRARALVIGEDLGTVPPGFRERLARWGILGSSVLLFERDRRGGFKRPQAYPDRVLASANTHDLAPIRSFWEESDLALRRRVGAIASDAELAAARRERARDRAALRRLLEAERALPRRHGEAGDGRLRGAVHDVLARTPAALVAISLDDLSGEREPVNLPGIPEARFPSWTRRMSMSLGRLRTDPDAARALAPVRRRRTLPQKAPATRAPAPLTAPR